MFFIVVFFDRSLEMRILMIQIYKKISSLLKKYAGLETKKTPRNFQE